MFNYVESGCTHISKFTTKLHHDQTWKAEVRTVSLGTLPVYLSGLRMVKSLGLDLSFSWFLAHFISIFRLNSMESHLAGIPGVADSPNVRFLSTNIHVWKSIARKQKGVLEIDLTCDYLWTGLFCQRIIAAPSNRGSFACLLWIHKDCRRLCSPKGKRRMSRI